MKPYWIFLLVSFITASPGYSQDKGTYYFFGGCGSWGLVHMTKQNNYGFHEMKSLLDLGYSYGLTAGLDINNKHKAELQLLISKAGAAYELSFESLANQKKIDITQLRIPLIYKYSFGSRSQFSREELQYFIAGGLSLDWTVSADIEWKIGAETTDFLTFVNRDDNPRIGQILRLGVVDEDEAFFRKIDVSVLFGGGLLYFLTDNIAVEAEYQFGLGLLDANDVAWRLKDRSGSYAAARHLFNGLKASFIYYIYNY